MALSQMTRKDLLTSSNKLGGKTLDLPPTLISPLREMESTFMIAQN